jgi:Flp pilus assembly pilin Flp
MNFLKDEGGQGAAEYILLFGGVIVIAIIALSIYKNYMNKSNNDLSAGGDINKVRDNVQ